MNETLGKIIGGLLACVVGLVMLYVTLGADAKLFDWLFG